MSDPVVPSPPPLHDKVTTGFKKLDTILQDGFNVGSAIILCAPPSDESSSLMRLYLKPTLSNEKTLFICRGLPSVHAICQPGDSNTSFLVCGERVSPSPGVLPGKGLDNLTELSLEISDAIRITQPKRIAIDIISDVLLRHGPLQTRKWMSEQLNRMRSKRITTLALLNPTMHSQTDTSAVLDLFDGNLEIFEMDIEGHSRKFLRIKWMHGITVTETDPLPLAFEPREPETVARGNLPPQLTRLFGREKELASSLPLLIRDEIRVLTLTGPAGTGKTALGLELARRLIPSFRDGVFLIPLASIVDPELVPQTIAGALGLKEKNDLLLIDNLKNYLQDRTILLVLDNFEQVIKAAPQIADLLVACPKLKVLVTSREALRIRGEREFVVHPLTLPDLTRLPGLEALSENPAVALFIDRAHAIKPDFELTNENARAVAEICYRLDGLPLALELAAARIKILTPQTLLRKLDSALGILTRGARDLPARQQTLRNAIAWSYDMLDDEDKRLFRRLAVFVGGFTLEAAESVGRSRDELRVDILECLSGLVDRSLLRQDVVEEEPRFSFLQTIREFSMECLVASTEYDTVCQDHAKFFLALAEGEAELRGPNQATLLYRLDRENDNLRAALRWTVEKHETEFGLRLVAALWRFWFVRGYVTEGRDWATKLLAARAERSLPRAKALLGAGSLAILHGDYDVSRRFYEESLAINRELDDNAGVAVSLYYLANLAHSQANYDTARELCCECLHINRELGDKRQIAYALSLLGEIAVSQGKFDEARAVVEESLILSRGLGEKLEIAMSLGYLGDIATRQGDFAKAEGFYDESLSLSKKLGHKEQVALVTFGRGRLARCQGNYNRAHILFSESLKLFSELGERDRLASGLEELGGLAVLDQQIEQAARLLAAAEVLREIIKTPIPPASRAEYERDVASVRCALTQQQFKSAWEQGRTLTPENAVAYALGKSK